VARLVPAGPATQARTNAGSAPAILDWLKRHKLPAYARRTADEIDTAIDEERKRLGLIYLDSCLVIYLAENHPRWGERMTDAIAQAAAARFSISSLVKCECLVGPMKRGDPVLGARL
jgi:hypothetical protein